MNKAIKINSADNVAVALCPLAKGEIVLQTPLQSDIPRGHKFAVENINKGEGIIKYGFAIGHALCNIQKGQWVHVQNVKTNLNEECTYSYNPVKNSLPKAQAAVFQGFMRQNGKAATRNEIWIIPTVGCVNGIAQKLCKDNAHLVNGSLDGIYACTHPFGCSQMGGDHAQTRRLLASLAHHPNAAGVLVLSLGCENLTQEQFKSELGEYDENRIKFLVCQESDDELSDGAALLSQLAQYAKGFARTEISADKLIIGMKCGGSDGLSGITANPAVGIFSDMLISQGGTTVLTEVPEMFGAEGMLMNRCESREVFDKAVNMVNGFKNYYTSHGQVVYENPSPGNKQGGITTLEDKSCGCVQKGGSAAITDVIEYGCRISKKGLNLLSGPGNDLVSATALTAAGAHIILFTTGRGTPFGAPAPTMKISTNTALAQKKDNWIDFNAGTAAENETVAQAGARLFNAVIEIASGKKTKAEEYGYREISILKDGVVL